MIDFSFITNEEQAVGGTPIADKTRQGAYH